MKLRSYTSTTSPLQTHANKLQVTTAQTLAGVTAQIAENNVDLPVAIAANNQQGTTGQTEANAAVKGTLFSSPSRSHH
jgi:hypothetical protein